MGAFFLGPSKFTVSAASQTATAPASNLNVNPPGLVWRSADLNAPYVEAQLTAGTAIDTLALVGNNLAATDTIRVRGSASSDMSSPAFDLTVQAWTGAAPKQGAVSIIALGGSFTPTYLRLDITSTGNAAGFVQASRLVAGTALRVGGVEVGAQKGWQDGSTFDEALGSTIIDPQRVRDTWKIGVSCVNRSDFYTIWDPFFFSQGSKGAFLFVPDDDALVIQNSACFGRLQPSGKSQFDSWDQCSFDLNIIQV